MPTQNDIFVNILKLRFGRGFNLNFGHDIEVILVRSSKLKFGQDFEEDLWLSF